MLTEERFAAILEELRMKNAVSVTELVEKLGASESTIRRDLNTLDEMGKLKKVHGGATAMDREYITSEPTVSDKVNVQVEEKKAIGRYAAAMINNDDFVFVDAGTSTEWMIEYIGESKATFITNGIAHAKKLLNKNLKTYIIGGRLKVGLTEEELQAIDSRVTRNSLGDISMKACVDARVSFGGTAPTEVRRQIAVGTEWLKTVPQL